MNTTLIDISPVIEPSIAVWPGDVPYRFEFSSDMREGDHLTLGSMQTSFHVGAHADAPNHYLRDGQSIGERSLDAYLGKCQVIEVSLKPNERILPAHVESDIAAQRVLFKTHSYPNPRKFNEDFNSLSPQLIEFLQAQQVILVGLDTPSVDPYADATLESHQAIAKHDMSILEGLVLSDVSAGIYTLVALPLRLQGADASPVRAVLLPHTENR